MSYPLSYILGPVFILLFFFAVIVTVCGIKYILSFLFPQKKVIEEKKPRKVVVKKPKTIRSIEINPEEIDKIYVRKSS